MSLRYTVHVVEQGHLVRDMDLWPTDRVIMKTPQGDFLHVGTVGSDGLLHLVSTYAERQ